MQKRKFDELVSYFNKKVSEMEIETKYKMELLGMVTALGCAHEKEMSDLSETKRDSSDLISRQEAIDALHMHLMYRMGTDSNKKRLDDWINNLPSAQPETHEKRTETHACDLISRQAAIDAIMCEPTDAHYPSWYAKRLEQLPSAQPEKVKCKKCRYVYYDKEFDNYWCNRMSDPFKVEEEGYCKWGK